MIRGGYMFFPDESEYKVAREKIELNEILRAFADESAANYRFLMQYVLKANFGPSKNKQEAKKIVDEIETKYRPIFEANEKRLKEDRLRDLQWERDYYNIRLSKAKNEKDKERIVNEYNQMKRQGEAHERNMGYDTFRQHGDYESRSKSMKSKTRKSKSKKVLPEKMSSMDEWTRSRSKTGQRFQRVFQK